MFSLSFTTTAEAQKEKVENDKSDAGLAKQLRKALGYLQTDPRHPSLHTHEFESLSTVDQKVFESYVQNRTPGAYRLFWVDSGKNEITVVAITSHP